MLTQKGDSNSDSDNDSDSDSYSDSNSDSKITAIVTVLEDVDKYPTLMKEPPMSDIIASDNISRGHRKQATTNPSEKLL